MVTAIANVAGDSIEQKLRVIPEGLPRFMTDSTIILLRNDSSSLSTQLNCPIPPTAVNDTISISASVVGDILGATLNNLEMLIQMPNGCGEQNMLNFVPNIVILRYLQATNKLTDAIRTKIVSFTELGYQRELEYFRIDGSFSAFGNADTNGSSWLTAYVLKSFLLAEDFITIDMNIVEQSINFIISKQNVDGSFREDGRVIHVDMQGGSSLGISLTAYISIVLTEALAAFPQFQAQRDSALNYLVNNFNSTEVYSLGILSYALSLAGHPSFNQTFTLFRNLATETTDELHWEKNQEVDPSNTWSQPQSLSVEITAYALLALYQINIGEALKVIRWLVGQQTSFGGFQSTQDTVVALEALGKFAAQLSVSSSGLNLTLTTSSGSPINASVNSDNALVLQTFDLPQDVRQLNVSAAGNGVAIVSLSCKFFELIEDKLPRFKIEHRFENPCLGFLKSSICLAYIPKPADEVSNMVLMRMTSPSGFIFDGGKSLNKVISVSSKLIF